MGAPRAGGAREEAEEQSLQEDTMALTRDKIRVRSNAGATQNWNDMLGRGPPIYISGASPPQWPTARSCPRRLMPRHQTFWAALSPCRYHPSPRPGRREPVPWPGSGGPPEKAKGLKKSAEHGKKGSSSHGLQRRVGQPVAFGPAPRLLRRHGMRRLQGARISEAVGLDLVLESA